MADADKSNRYDDSDVMKPFPPVNEVPWSASGAGYAALLSFLPVVGIFFAIIAIDLGIKTIKGSILAARGPTKGLARAWFCIVTGIVVLNVYVVVLVFFIFIAVRVYKQVFRD
ncbi:MAG: hypothetical protein ACRCZF_13920 [Gemmataceae bacterium]